MKALILAGGFGTRLKSITGDEIPKPMVSIWGKPFIEHQIMFLKEQGIRDIIIAVHHLSDVIKSYCGDGRLWLTNITYSEEEKPLGTAGAIKNAKKYLDDTFIVLNGDTFSNIDLKKLVEFHKNNQNKATVALTKIEDTKNYGSVFLEGDKIKSFSEKIEGSGFINRGVYVFEPEVLKLIDEEKNVSLEKELFPKMAQEGNLFGYLNEGYFIDIGRPETYQKFKQDMLRKLFISSDESIRSALQQISKNMLDLLLVVDKEDKLLGVINERFIRNFILNGGDVDKPVVMAMITSPVTVKISDSQQKIDDLLKAGIHRIPVLDDNGIVKDIAFRAEKIISGNFPIIRGRCPLRISFSGGGTDLPEFFEKYGENLEEVSGSVRHTGEGAWTVEAAKELGVSVPIIEGALRFRVESESSSSFIGKILSALRNQFGGHDIKT